VDCVIAVFGFVRDDLLATLVGLVKEVLEAARLLSQPPPLLRLTTEHLFE
jgi:hypothetical protein